jgi:photosystem II stability/assembly factor-like uncharacterized protein
MHLPAPGPLDYLFQIPILISSTGKNLDPIASPLDQFLDQLHSLGHAILLPAGENTRESQIHKLSQGLKRIRSHIKGSMKHGLKRPDQAPNAVASRNINLSIGLQNANYNPIGTVFNRRFRVAFHARHFSFGIRETSSSRTNHDHDRYLQPPLGLLNRPYRRRQPAQKKRRTELHPICPTLFRLNRVIDRSTTDLQQNLRHGLPSFRNFDLTHNIWHNHRMRPHVLLIVFLATSLVAQNLTIQKSNTTENLRGISVPPNQVAWASGTHGTYLRTTDGGTSWHRAQVPNAEALDFRDVEAFSADFAYLLSAGPGEQSRIYKTTDAGKTWALQFTNKNPKGFFDCMAFWDRDRGIALGDPVIDNSGKLKFELIATANGGTTWELLSTESLPPAIEGEGAFAASGTCIAVQGTSNVWFATGGKAARVFRSADAGKTWSVAETPISHGSDSAGIFSIVFRDAIHGVIAGGDYKHPDQDGPHLAFTNDGGLTWTLSPIAPQRYFSAVAFAKPHSESSAILVVGTSHSAYENDITKISSQKTWDLNLNAISISPTGEAIAVGPKGLIVSIP